MEKPTLRLEQQEPAAEFEFSGKRFKIFKDVYNPAEDSFMLAKYSASRASGRILDVGTGSGIQAIFANASVAVDINEKAVENARYNCALNNCKCEVIHSDLFSKVSGEFDTIIFNPPYLPTSPDEVTKGPIDLAWNGGSDGRAVIDKFLALFSPFLAPGGKLLMLHSSLADTEKTVLALRHLGFKVEILEEKNIGEESLCVLEATKPKISAKGKGSAQLLSASTQI
ncbi:putative S-adenosylmethionine-dependent methyltransferase [Candidatus Gugararchaeum adminiculabundum]|nr:putative S-adenosylmethionine-dependent methyltransferase [Candidatus Gugararchaeum adminiculabundum]